MAVGFLVRANGEFRDMRGHRAIGHLQHHVLSPSTALLPIFQREIARICDKIGVPNAAWIGFAFTAEIFRIAIEAVGEIARRVENEICIVKQVKDDRHAIDGEKSRRLVAGAVKVLVPSIERQRKKTTLLPLEGLLHSFIIPDSRRASSLENKMQIFV